MRRPLLNPASCTTAPTPPGPDRRPRPHARRALTRVSDRNPHPRPAP
jgi:hypothetical protein